MRSVVLLVNVWSAANVLVRDYGEDAEIIAAQQADALLAAGDVEGQRAFKAIAKAVGDLLRKKPCEGEALN